MLCLIPNKVGMCVQLANQKRLTLVILDCVAFESSVCLHPLTQSLSQYEDIYSHIYGKFFQWNSLHFNI